LSDYVFLLQVSFLWFSSMMFQCHLCDGCFLDERKQDENLWLCSLCQPCSMRLLLCHSSKRQFDLEDGHNRHEFLCCLKLPPGSCFICEFCGTSIAIHNHSSFVRHKKHCALNPASAVASSVVHKNCSKVAMVHGYRSSNVVKNAKKSDVPICECYVDTDRYFIMWSQSSIYPGCKYYHCSKFKRDWHCNFLQWYD